MLKIIVVFNVNVAIEVENDKINQIKSSFHLIIDFIHKIYRLCFSRMSLRNYKNKMFCYRKVIESLCEYRLFYDHEKQTTLQKKIFKSIY